MTVDVLAVADDALIAAQRLSEWCSRGPELEEDIALANIALDQLGAARLLLTLAGSREQPERTEDELAFLRTDREFRNCLLVELPNGDFAVTVAKLLFLSAYQRPLYEELAAGEDAELAAIAAKAVKESAYHLDHAALWTVRLGDGTEESHRRMQNAVDEIWPYTHELVESGLAARDGWLSTVDGVLAEATLARPEDGWRPTGGRTGVHTEHLSLLLAEMQVLHRAHPGSDMVTDIQRAVAAVADPELRVLTIADLGILRGVETAADGRVTVTITPTYTGCPAMDVIRRDIVAAARAAGAAGVEVRTELSPPWSTDWISADGRAKLAAAGIAPPTGRRAQPRSVTLTLTVRCTRCGSPDTEELSRFGSTACKSLWRCRVCREPFDAIKAH